jgi:hypothetical protein
MLSPFALLMLAFAALFILFLIPLILYGGVHLVVVFFIIITLIFLGGFIGKALSLSPFLDRAYDFVSNPIVTFFFVLIGSIGMLFVFGSDIEKRLVVYGLAIIAVMLVLLPLAVRQQLVSTLFQWFIAKKLFTESDVILPEVAFIIMGFALYVIAIMLSAYVIDHK